MPGTLPCAKPTTILAQGTSTLRQPEPVVNLAAALRRDGALVFCKLEQNFPSFVPDRYGQDSRRGARHDITKAKG